MKQEKKKTKVRKEYERPRLRIVNISGGVQTLGIGCKTAAGGGQDPIAVPCWATGCAKEGS